MRVLHLISSGGLYGAEAVILQLSSVLNHEAQDTSHIAVFSHDSQPTPALYGAAEAAGIPVHLVPCHGQLDRRVAARLRALTKQLGVEVVHAHGYKADIYTFAAFRRHPRPALVSTCHTWYDNDIAVRLYGAADRWVLRFFDEVVAVSEAVKRRLLGAGVASKRIHIVRNGISVASPPSAPRNADDIVRVGLVGRLAPEKGVDVFLDAAAVLFENFPTVLFVVAGDGPERDALEQQIVRLGLDGHAVLQGQQRDMETFYRSLDLLVSASRQEGLPMALLEGMGTGLAVVATRVGEVPQVVVDGETGLLVAPGSAPKLAEAIGRLLADGALREALGRAGRQRVREHFSAEGMTAAYLNVYRRALARCGTIPGAARADVA